MERTVLVTGAAGAVGARLLPALSAAGWRTRALVHRRSVEGADEQVRGELGDPESLRAATVGASAVLHLAARTHARHERDYWITNVGGTERLLAAATSSGVDRFVHVSTRAASPAGGGYSRSKHHAEDLVRSGDLEHVIVRLPEIYGAAGREGVDEMVARARRGAPIPVVGRGRDLLCPVHVDDVTVPLAAALSEPRAAGRTYTLAGDCLPARELARACSDAFGGRSRIVGVPVTMVRLAGLAARFLPLPLYPDQLARLRAVKAPGSSAATSELGFRPRPLQEGLTSVRPRGSP